MIAVRLSAFADIETTVNPPAPDDKPARFRKMLKDFVIALALFLLGYYTFN